MTPGSCDRAAETATTRLLQLGATNLQAKLGAHVASRGDTCFENDREVGKILRRWDGRAYHRESIGRARRQMARRGWLDSVRIMPQHKPPGARWRSSHGTTSKHICWKFLGLRNPMTRGERREAREKRKKMEHDLHQEREITLPARVARAAFDTEFLAMMEGVKMPTAAPRGPRREIRREQDPSMVRERERERQTRAIESAADARARLAKWARDNERGPPDD